MGTAALILSFIQLTLSKSKLDSESNSEGEILLWGTGGMRGDENYWFPRWGSETRYIPDAAFEM